MSPSEVSKEAWLKSVIQVSLYHTLEIVKKHTPFCKSGASSTSTPAPSLNHLKMVSFLVFAT